MKPSTYIKRKIPLCLVHPWDRARIARTLHRRAMVRFWSGCGFLAASCFTFGVNAALWLVEAAVVALLVAAWLIGRAWFLAATAAKYRA